MDFVLGLADEYILDRVYATLIPAVAPVAQAASFTFSSNGSYIPANPSSSAWSKIAALIPAAKDMVAGAPVLPAKLGAPLASALTGTSAWPRDCIPRQLLSLTLITLAGVHALYFIFAWLSYTFVFDHRMMKHPRFLKNQIRLEIECSLRAFPGMTLLTLPWFLAEVRGHTKLYDNVSDYGWLWFFASIPTFFLFTDYGIYWIHRWEHHPAVYKYVHKPHHKWVIPTPFASHAFHPVDGYLQSLPYHFFVHIFPFHKWLYLGLFVFVNFWTILIHDSDLITGHPLEKVVNGPAHHTLHHMYFTVNYGQYFTWADRAGGSYRQPVPGDDPLLDVLANEEKESKKTQ